MLQMKRRHRASPDAWQHAWKGEGREASLTAPGTWAREAHVGEEQGEEVARPLSIVQSSLGRKHLWHVNGHGVGAEGSLDDHPELAVAQLDELGTGQEGRALGMGVLRKEC